MSDGLVGYDLRGSGQPWLCIPDPLPNDGIVYQPFTIEHWLWLDDISDNRGLLTNIPPGSAWSDGGLNVYIRSQTGAGYSFAADGKTLRVGTPPVGQWVHVAWVYTGSRFEIFVSGTSLGTVSISHIPVKTGYLHSRFNNTEQAAIWGKVARLRFWDRALTAAEVLVAGNSIYDASEPGLIVQYEFDEGPGTPFAKPDRPAPYALMLNYDPANAANLVANRMRHIYAAPAWDRSSVSEIAGIVYDARGLPCRRKVYAVSRPIDDSPPEVLAYGWSDPVTGEYKLQLPTTEEVSRIVVSEDDESPLLNDLIDRILPE